MDVRRKLKRFDIEILSEPTVFWFAVVFSIAGLIGMAGGAADAWVAMIGAPIIAFASKVSFDERGELREEEIRLTQRIEDLGWRAEHGLNDWVSQTCRQ
jgi:hypothetical protein